MKILIAYATREGHTRKIARHLADRLVDAGQSVELLTIGDADGLDLDRFHAVVLAAPIHMGYYPSDLTDFLSENAGRLNAKPSFFLSMSLAAAGHDAEDWRSLDNILDDLLRATEWRPRKAKHVAGAYRPSQYDLVRRLVMRQIVGRKDPDADLSKDKEYTDWADLDANVDEWLAGVQA